MTQQEAIEIVRRYAPHYPDQAVFYVTEDGQVFFEPHTADTHKRSLKGTDVQEVLMSDLIEGESDTVREDTNRGDQDDESGETDEDTNRGNQDDESGESDEDTNRDGEDDEAAEAKPAGELKTVPNKATMYGKQTEEPAAEKPAGKNKNK